MRSNWPFSFKSVFLIELAKSFQTREFGRMNQVYIWFYLVHLKNEFTFKLTQKPWVET